MSVEYQWSAIVCGCLLIQIHFCWLMDIETDGYAVIYNTT